MSDTQQLPISIQPVISYPLEAEVGKTYLMEIDIKQTDDFEKWTYEEEEYPIYCRVDTYSYSREDITPLFKIKHIGEPAVVLHRFGGTYGAAKFLLTSAPKKMTGEIRVTLVSSWGVPFKRLRLKNVSITQEGNTNENKIVDYVYISQTVLLVKKLLPYESAEDLNSVLDFISKRHSEGRDTSEEDVTELFHKPKGDDGTFYLLENLQLLEVLVITASGKAPGTVRYDLSPSYLNQYSPKLYPPPDGDEFDERLQQLYSGQRELLDLIRQRNQGSIPFWQIYLFMSAVESGSYSLMRYVSSKMGCSRNQRQQDTSLEDAAPLFFTHPEGGDIATYRRLENLRLLSFLSITEVGTSRETLRYNLSLKYQKYMAYLQLENYLKNRQWKEADEETYRLMIQTVGKEVEQLFDREEIENFPCEDLRIIDQLWLKYSSGHFGFSVQKNIWLECDSPREYGEDWNKFGFRVGWRKGEEWIDYNSFTFDLSAAPKGQLPASGWWARRGESIIRIRVGLFSRAKTCNL